MRKFFICAGFLCWLVCGTGCFGKGDDTVEPAATAEPEETGPPPEEEGTESPFADEAGETGVPSPAVSALLVDEAFSEGENRTLRQTEEPLQATPRQTFSGRALDEEEVGLISYLEREVSIARDGRIHEDIEFGTGVENYDVIQTGEMSRAEVQLSAPSFASTVIIIEENTAFSLELSRVGEVSRSSLEVLNGSLAFKVNSLLGNQALDVNSEVAVIGVRGTVFSVSSLPSGDFLLTCSEGAVECRDREGKSFGIKPGQALEKMAGEDFVPLTMGGKAESSFREDWMETRVRLMQNDALSQIRKNVTAYEQYREQFDLAYTALFSEKEILERWYAEDEAGTLGSSTEQMRDKKVLIPYLFKLRQSLVGVNRVYHRLLELKTLHTRGYGAGTLPSGEKTGDFFRKLETDGTADKVARVQYVLKLYAKRSIGMALLDEFAGMDDDADFFGNSDAFFDEEDDFFGKEN